MKDKSILITGGTGSWGNELTSQLLERDPKEIIIFSRNEFMQVTMQRKFNNSKIKFVIGDVRDNFAVNQVFHNNQIDYVFHLAALKHIPICENQPFEVIKTNVNGTNNLIQNAIKYKVKKFIDVSSDKAVAPYNLYGLTKAIGEKLTIQANNLTNDTDFICIRGGNVLGSSGSVLPLFIDQIKKFNKVTITDKGMTRYFLSLSEAISLMFQGVENCVGGETFVMNMPSFYIMDLTELLIELYGNKDTKIEEIGIRESEKLHEILISEHEAKKTYIFNKNYYAILPSIKINKDYSHLNNNQKYKGKEFSSLDNLQNKEFLHKMLLKTGLLV